MIKPSGIDLFDQLESQLDKLSIEIGFDLIRRKPKRSGLIGAPTMRRRRTSESSLELLLDTICKSVVGSLLAILIAMLLRMRTTISTGAPPSAVNQLSSRS